MSDYIEAPRLSSAFERRDGRFVPFSGANDVRSREITIFALLTEAVRRWRMIALVVVPAMLLALVYVVATPRSYTAGALVEVTGSNGNAMSDAPPGPNYQEAEAVQTQVEAIRAASVVNELAARLSEQDRRTILGGSAGFLAPFETFFGPLRPAADTRAGDDRRLKDILADDLGVAPLGLSAVIAISFTAYDPELAARLANDVVAIASEQARRRSADVMSQGISPIASQIGILREQLARERDEARSFRERNDLYGAQGISALRAQLAVLNRRLADARSQQLAAQSKVDALGAVATPDNGGGGSSSEVLASPTITRLRDQLSLLTAELQGLSASLGERHPRVRQARSQVAETKARLDSETATILRSVRQDSEASRTEEDLLARAVDDLKDRIAIAAKAEEQAAELDRHAAATEAVYTQMLQREALLRQMRSSALFVTSVRPVSPADVPWKPSHPRSVLILVLVGTIALVAGLVATLVAQYWSSNRSEKRPSGFRRG